MAQKDYTYIIRALMHFVLLRLLNAATPNLPAALGGRYMVYVNKYRRPCGMMENERVGIVMIIVSSPRIPFPFSWPYYRSLMFKKGSDPTFPHICSKVTKLELGGAQPKPQLGNLEMIVRLCGGAMMISVTRIWMDTSNIQAQ